METKDTMSKQAVRVVSAVALGMIVWGIEVQMLGLSLPNLMKEFKISPVMGGALQTYNMIGMGIGGICGGWIADRIGRVRVALISVLLFSLGAVVIGFCQMYWQIAAMLSLSGAGLGATYTIGFILAAEYVPTKIRNTILGTLQALCSVGFVISAILAAYIQPAWGWRPLFFVAIIPGIICAVMLHGVSDPASWFTTRQAIRASGKKENTFAKIWKDPVTRHNFLFWSAGSICLQFSYYGATTWLPSYLVKDLGVNLKAMGWYLAGTYVCAILGKVLTGWLADIFGRRSIWVVTGLTAAIAIPLIIHIATRANVAYLLLIFGILYAAPYAIVATYMSESFPTSVRGTAQATAYNMGRFGSTMAPLMIGWAASVYSFGFGIALLGFSYALCALIPGIFISEKMFDPKAVEGEEGETSKSKSTVET